MNIRLLISGSVDSAMKTLHVLIEQGIPFIQVYGSRPVKKERWLIFFTRKVRDYSTPYKTLNSRATVRWCADYYSGWQGVTSPPIAAHIMIYIRVRDKELVTLMVPYPEMLEFYENKY